MQQQLHLQQKCKQFTNIGNLPYKPKTINSNLKNLNRYSYKYNSNTIKFPCPVNTLICQLLLNGMILLSNSS